MRFEVVHDIEKDKWDDYVFQHPKGNIFHTHALFEVFKKSKNHYAFKTIVVDKDTKEIFVLLLSTIVQIWGGLLSRFTSRSIIYGGILDKKEGKIDEKIEAGLMAHDKAVRKLVLFTEIRNRDDTSEYMSVMGKKGYGYDENLTYFIELNKGENKIFKRFTKDRRKNIRKAEKMGVRVREVKDLSEVKIFYEIIQKIYSKRKVFLADLSLFENSFKSLHEKGMFKIFLADGGGKVIGGQAILAFKNNILTWYGAAYDEFSYFHANEFMMWHVIKWGISNGFDILDLGGAGKPGEPYGPREFKKRFGGKLVSFGRYYKVYSPMARNLAEIGYKIYQKCL